MSDKTLGLFQKYSVTRADHKPVAWCFVLEDRDPLAVEALRTYMKEARYAGYERLADDLAERLQAIDDSDRCESCGRLSYDEDFMRVDDDGIMLCPKCLDEGDEP